MPSGPNVIRSEKNQQPGRMAVVPGSMPAVRYRRMRCSPGSNGEAARTLTTKFHRRFTYRRTIRTISGRSAALRLSCRRSCGTQPDRMSWPLVSRAPPSPRTAGRNDDGHKCEYGMTQSHPLGPDQTLGEFTKDHIGSHKPRRIHGEILF